MLKTRHQRSDLAIHASEACQGQITGAEGDAQRAFQLVCQGVLAVVVPADCGGLPPPRPGLQVRDQPDLRLGAALGHPELLRQHRIAEHLGGVPSKTVSSRPNAVPPGPVRMSARAASASKTFRITCSPSRSRAFDSAGPVGVTVPGFTGRPGIPNTFARIMS